MATRFTAAARRLRCLPWFTVTLVIVAAVCFVRFVITGDVDKALLAVAFAALACYEADHRQVARKLRTAMDANAAAALELSRTAGIIHALLFEKRLLNAQLAGYVARFGPILAHDKKFADMPLIGRKPLPVPEGHPEHSGGS